MIPFRKKLNHLDSLITESMLQCKKKLGKCFHETDWSITLHQCAIECEYWQTRIQGYNNHINVDKQAYDIIKELPNETIQLLRSKHNNNIFNEYRKAIKRRKDIMDHTTELRQRGMEKLVEIQEREGNTVHASIIKKISHFEDRKRDWNKLNSVYNPEQRSSLNCIEIPSADSEGNPTNDVDIAKTWSTMTQPKEDENVIIERNTKHFGQAEGSPFTQENLQDLLGYDGVSNAIEELLTGNINHVDLTAYNPGTTQILQRLATNHKLQDVDDDITYEEWCQLPAVGPVLGSLQYSMFSGVVQHVL